MTTGRTSPACFWVAALNSLQKAMMLTPCWPSAGPTGGAGFACPAGICKRMMPVTSFAINLVVGIGRCDDLIVRKRGLKRRDIAVTGRHANHHCENPQG